MVLKQVAHTAEKWETQVPGLLIFLVCFEVAAGDLQVQASWIPSSLNLGYADSVAHMQRNYQKLRNF
jgi:hypothetical protein